MKMKSDVNDNCETGVSFSNSVLDMCIVNLPVCLHTLRAYSWHVHNAVACRLRCEYISFLYRRHRKLVTILDWTILSLSDSCIHARACVHVMPWLGQVFTRLSMQRPQVSPHEIRVGQSGTGTSFSPIQFSVPVSFHWCFMHVYDLSH